MDENRGQPSAPQTPPPAFTPPPPAYQAPATTDTQYAQPQPAYASPSPAKPKKKTWLWVLLALVVVGLLGCCVASALGGLALFKFASEPTASIDAINQAALDGDTESFEKYFDTEAVTRNAYDDFLEYIKSGEDYASIVAELGEEEADRILREDVLPEDQFVAEMSAQFTVEGLDESEVPFPNYEVRSNTGENDTAELTIVTIEEGEEVTYILGFVREPYNGETIWRLTEIKNIADLLGDGGTTE